jgi:hypothetical protein
MTDKLREMIKKDRQMMKDRRDYVRQNIQRIDRYTLIQIITDYVKWRWPDEYALEVDEYIDKIISREID